jgi:predicted negative regulator of RcsB-dependent stress response
METAIHEYPLHVRAGGKTYSLDFRQAFQFGYTLLRTGKYTEATQIFETMTHSGSSIQLPTIMLAYCKALVKDYEASQSLLMAAFPDNKIVVADQLHTAFVYVSLGMWDDAFRELAEVVRQYTDLPVICLLLGDLLASQGRRANAITSWRLAVERDHKDGAVAAFIQQLVSSSTKSHTRP